MRARLVTTLVAAALLLCACAGTPPPDWQLGAHASLRRAVEAQLSGQDRVAALEFDRARGEIARSGRTDLMARAELMRCAAAVAALVVEPCAGFERLRADAPAAEVAYADHLAGTLRGGQRALLPAAQQALAGPASSPEADLAALLGTADPLSRLVAAALWLRQGRATPAVLQVAVDTASGEGWRRPLLAWLRLQQQQALGRGASDEAARLGRRIELVLQGPATP